MASVQWTVMICPRRGIAVVEGKGDWLAASMLGKQGGRRGSMRQEEALERPTGKGLGREAFACGEAYSC